MRFDGIDVSGGYFGWEGDEFQDIAGGARIGVLPLLRVGDLWNVGVEGVYAKSEIQLVVIPVFLKETGVNAVVRWSFSDPSEVHAYVQGRGGWSRLEGEARDGPGATVTTRSQSGYGVGAEFGVGLPAGRYIDILWAGSLGWNSYTQCEAFSPGYSPVNFGDDCSAVRWGVRVGVVLGRSDG